MHVVAAPCVVSVAIAPHIDDAGGTFLAELVNGVGLHDLTLQM